MLWKKFQITYINKGYFVVVRCNGKWEFLRYEESTDEHYRGEYLMFKTYGSALKFARKHTKGDYTKWV